MLMQPLTSHCITYNLVGYKRRVSSHGGEEVLEEKEKK
jgi:hypothetical protein